MFQAPLKFYTSNLLYSYKISNFYLYSIFTSGYKCGVSTLRNFSYINSAMLLKIPTSREKSLSGTWTNDSAERPIKLHRHINKIYIMSKCIEAYEGFRTSV